MNVGCGLLFCIHCGSSCSVRIPVDRLSRIHARNAFCRTSIYGQVNSLAQLYVEHVMRRMLLTIFAKKKNITQEKCTTRPMYSSLKMPQPIAPAIYGPPKLNIWEYDVCRCNIINDIIRQSKSLTQSIHQTSQEYDIYLEHCHILIYFIWMRLIFPIFHHWRCQCVRVSVCVCFYRRNYTWLLCAPNPACQPARPKPARPAKKPTTQVEIFWRVLKSKTYNSSTSKPIHPSQCVHIIVKWHCKNKKKTHRCSFSKLCLE